MSACFSAWMTASNALPRRRTRRRRLGHQGLGSRARRRARPRRVPRPLARRDDERSADALPIRRNTLILAVDDGGLLGGAPARRGGRSLTFVLVTGVHGLLGLGPGDLPDRVGARGGPGRAAMDRFGRRPVIAGGYLSAAAGCSLTALATNLGSTPLRDHRLRADRRGERRRPADPHRGGRHVPARAARPRHLLRALRLGVRRDPRPRACSARCSPAASSTRPR